MCDEDNDSQHLLTHVTEARDLGVIVDARLSFDNHIASKVSKANSILHLIWRSFTFIDTRMLITMYKSLIRPHLEYANCVWNPLKKKHIVALENVQRRATKLIPSLKDYPYIDRLRILNLPTLSYRRLRGDMIETYKILTNKYDPMVTPCFTRANTTTRGHSLKLFNERALTSGRTSLPFVSSRTETLYHMTL